ncbi:lysoplasmalogenase [Flavobacteriaceae bacterium]|nr:lysoplasmalogenase [Flavobacteriaceae bacterium]
MKRVAYLFWIIGILHVFGQYTNQELLTTYTKPLIIPLLAIFYYNKQAGKLFLIALGCSWLGDLFLMGESRLFFLLGIFSFWGAQLCYLYLIVKEIQLPFKKLFLSKEILLPLILFGSYFVGTMSLLGTKLGMMSFPVNGYALTLATIGAVSILLWRKKKSLKTLALLFGVVLFIVSDSMIAFNNFYFQGNIFGFWIMATYIPAQFLICNYFRKNT